MHSAVKSKGKLSIKVRPTFVFEIVTTATCPFGKLSTKVRPTFVFEM